MARVRALQIAELEGPDALSVVDLPEPAASHFLTPDQGVLIDVRAAAVSFPDLLQSRGLYQFKPELPFVPGAEVAGVVAEAPPDTGLEAGDRVAAMLREGERVLVHGAAGGLGTACLQVAKALGASTVAVVSTEEKERVAREAGADDAVRSDGPWREQVQEITGGGVDVVLDPVGGDRFTDSLRALREEGRLVVVGFTGGSIPEVKVNRLLLNNVDVVGAGWGAYVVSRPELSREIGAELDTMIAEGTVRPVVGARFPLDRASDAMRLIEERGALGKVVLEVS